MAKRRSAILVFEESTGNIYLFYMVQEINLSLSMEMERQLEALGMTRDTMVSSGGTIFIYVWYERKSRIT